MSKHNMEALFVHGTVQALLQQVTGSVGAGLWRACFVVGRSPYCRCLCMAPCATAAAGLGGWLGAFIQLGG